MGAAAGGRGLAKLSRERARAVIPSPRQAKRRLNEAKLCLRNPKLRLNAFRSSQNPKRNRRKNGGFLRQTHRCAFHRDETQCETQRSLRSAPGRTGHTLRACPSGPKLDVTGILSEIRPKLSEPVRHYAISHVQSRQHPTIPPLIRRSLPLWTALLMLSGCRSAERSADLELASQRPPSTTYTSPLIVAPASSSNPSGAGIPSVWARAASCSIITRSSLPIRPATGISPDARQGWIEHVSNEPAFSGRNSNPKTTFERAFRCLSTVRRREVRPVINRTVSQAAGRLLWPRGDLLVEFLEDGAGP